MSGRGLAIDVLRAPPDAEIAVPGSKSLTNRMLVAAAMAEGHSTLRNVLVAEDTLAMIGALSGLGAAIRLDEVAATIEVTGTGGVVTATDSTLWVRQSGTTARFVLALAALSSTPVMVDGDDQIRSRPQSDLVAALASLGASFEMLGVDGRLPMRSRPSTLRGGPVEVKGDVSSQYVSALLLAAPLFDRGLDIVLTGPPVSAPYLGMTVAAMEEFGATVEVTDGRRYTVGPGPYRGTDVTIEPDASTASYFFAAAAVSGGRVAVPGLGSKSMQGDLEFVEILASMGATVRRGPDRTEVVGPKRLGGVDVAMRHLSDTAPTLAAIAPLATGEVHIRDVENMRFKESDRIAAVVTELRRLGAEVTEHSDGLSVFPSTLIGTLVQTYDDHRLAMAFTMTGLMVPDVRIADPSCVAKTFPGFFDAVDALHAAGDAQLAVLAIDGPAGSGKSTVSQRCAAALGLEVLDTGAMYRCVALAALRRGLDPGDTETVAAMCRHLDIDVGAQGVRLDGDDVTAAIRSEAVDSIVSIVAANPGVRASLRRQQRAWARRRGGGVLEGRDIASVVLPGARLKVYVTASPEERARRRSAQSGADYEEILAGIVVRDRLDSNRADSPLTEVDGALVLDTTNSSIDSVVDAIVQAFR